MPQLLVGGGGNVRCNDFGVVGGRDAVHLSEVLGVECLDPVEVLVGEGCRLHAIDDHGDKNGVVNSELPMEVLRGARHDEACQGAFWFSSAFL